MLQQRPKPGELVSEGILSGMSCSQMLYCMINDRMNE